MSDVSWYPTVLSVKLATVKHSFTLHRTQHRTFQRTSQKCCEPKFNSELHSEEFGFVEGKWQRGKEVSCHLAKRLSMFDGPNGLLLLIKASWK